MRALVDGAWLLRLAGDAASADEADGAAAQLRRAITASLEQVAARLGRLAMPAAPERSFDAGMIGALVACAPLGLLPPDDPWVRRHPRRGAGALLLEGRLLRRRRPHRPGPVTDVADRPLRARGGRSEGVAPAAVDARRRHAHVHVAGSDPSPPGRRLPGRRAPRRGERPPSSASSARCSCGRHRTGASPWPRSSRRTGRAGRWRSTTPRHTTGRISYALRWHGDRPALLWQCERPGVTLTVPGPRPVVLDRRSVRRSAAQPPTGPGCLSRCRTPDQL